MKEEKSLRYTLILGVCILLSLLLLGRMLLHSADQAPPARPPDEDQPQTEEQPMSQLIWTEEDLLTMLGQALPLTPNELTVQIGGDGTVAVSAAVTKQTLSDSGLLTGNMRTALLFLPDPCKLYGAWSVEASDGAIVLTAQRAEAAGFALPAQTIEQLTTALNEQIAAQLQAQQIVLSGLSCEDGRLLLYPQEA